MMIDVSFTKFLDFVAQTGEPKATTAISAWRQSNTPYDPKRDYHKFVREELIGLEKTGNVPDWDAFVASMNPKKQKNYKETIDAYMKWRSRAKPANWFKPPRGEWPSSEFRININPEMGLEISGERHAIKLFINKQKLSRLKAQMAGLVMHKALGLSHPNYRFSIFDIKEGKLHTYAGTTEKLEYLLVGEMAHLSAMLSAIRGT